jgi:hypothetical protein
MPDARIANLPTQGYEQQRPDPDQGIAQSKIRRAEVRQCSKRSEALSPGQERQVIGNIFVAQRMQKQTDQK